MVSHDPKPPQPTNLPPISTDAAPLAPRPPSSIPKGIADVMPKLDLIVEDVLCPGANRFLAAVQPAILLQEAVAGVLKELYDAKTVPSRVKNLRLIIKETDGVASTSGSHSDKTIVFNAKYIEKLGQRTRDEILGVIRHEAVHCFQYDGDGAAPIGLIEGIADFVRLRAGLAPPHWKRGDKDGGRWDAGYEKTGFFLDWLENVKGDGTVKRINLALSEGKYHEKRFWKGVLGEHIEDLWEQYVSA